MFGKIKIKLANIKKFVSTTTFIFLLVMPASTNYKLKDFGIGSGGVGNANSANYAMEAINGEMG